MKRVFVMVLLYVIIAGVSVPHATQAQPSSEAARISRVESSLVTPVVIKGQPVQRISLRSRMRHYHIPAVSIAFFDANGIRWARAYGAATPATLFQAGSISKPVSAVGLMLAVQNRRLNLDENVNHILHTWKVPENALTAKQPVTLRELLSMTAGTTVPGFEGYERGKPLPTLEQILDGKPPANSPPVRVNLQPGTHYRYSGGGSTIAQLMLLSVVRQSFATYMHKNVLAPMGMSSSTFEQPLPTKLWPRAISATDPSGKTYPGNWHVYPTQFAAGLWSTPSDLARFAIGMQRSLDGAPNAVLSQKNAELMVTPVKDHYGFNFEAHRSGTSLRFGHTGANAGFQADLTMYRGGEGVAIMTNSDNGLLLIAEVLSSISSVYGWGDFRPIAKTVVASIPSTYGRFIGRYNFDGGILTVSRSGNSLYLDGLSGRHKLYPEARSTFFMLEQPFDITFNFDASANVTGLSIVQNGEKVTAKRLKP